MARINDKIGPYILISKLGRGAFGVVWLAEKRSAITAAIKIQDYIATRNGLNVIADLSVKKDILPGR